MEYCKVYCICLLKYTSAAEYSYIHIHAQMKHILYNYSTSIQEIINNAKVGIKSYRGAREHVLFVHKCIIYI